MRQLGLAEVSAYRAWLEVDPGEWAALEALCPVTISRFYRDRGVFDRIGRELLPDLAQRVQRRGESSLRMWSAGCASGEEPYTLAILYRLEIAPRFPTLAMNLIATDIDDRVLDRARRGCYGAGSLKELPRRFVETAFRRDGVLYCVRDEYRAGIEFRCEDLRRSMSAGPFDLILCRNLAFTYFEEDLQRDVVRRFATRVVPGGLLVLGNREVLPPGTSGFAPEAPAMHAYRRIDSGS
jgi:chemotaxis protein methyltransferase CheR